MTILVKINNFVSAFVDALKSIFYLRLWTPFFIFMLISGALAYMVLNPFAGPWSAAIISIGKSGLFGGGEAFIHYPQHLLISPAVHSRLGLILSVFLDSLLTGVAFIMFAGFFSGNRIGFIQAIKRALSRYQHLIILNLIIYAILMAVNLLLPQIFEGALIGNTRRIFVFILGFRLLLFFIFSFFIFAIPYVVLQNENVFTAILKSFRTFFRNFFTAFFAVFITQLLIQPFTLGIDYSATIAQKFSPETISVLLYLEIFTTMIASFLFTAMVTRLFTEYHE
jgi:hypothetical protein